VGRNVSKLVGGFFVSNFFALGFFLLTHFEKLHVINFIEPYSITKGTLREEVCSRLIKLLINTLTFFLTCGAQTFL
jgi:hypothetical protein